MNLIVIPYHDWRKIEQEGSRTRDAHFIEEFRKSNKIDKLIILNRPITKAEIILKRKSREIKGEVILKENGSKLISIDDKTYIIDIFLSQNIRHLLQKRKWYFHAYQNENVISFVTKCLKKLKIDQDYYLLSQNVIASQFINHISPAPKKSFFDAWDNFRLMPGLNPIHGLLDKAYFNYSKNTTHWYTNSTENIFYYKSHYKASSVSLLKNGVDYDRFNHKHEKPEDLNAFKNPIVGFGGKITHLFDYELFNYIVLKNPDLDFVVVGQILNRNVFNRIKKYDNLYFLGDKHYNEYPTYVKNFDIGIIPYVTGKKQHNGDSIKAYEYLAAGLKVIGTRGSGIQDLEEYLYVANSPEEFSEYLRTDTKKKKFNAEEHSWSKKAEKIVEDFQN